MDEDVPRHLRSTPELTSPATRHLPPRHANPKNRDQILARLRDHAPDLRRHGVVRAALFGSTARCEAWPDSDIDILVELDPEVIRTLFDDVGVTFIIEDLFETAVDVIDRQGLKSHVRPHVMRDAHLCFLTAIAAA